MSEPHPLPICAQASLIQPLFHSLYQFGQKIESLPYLFVSGAKWFSHFPCLLPVTPTTPVNLHLSCACGSGAEYTNLMAMKRQSFQLAVRPFALVPFSCAVRSAMTVHPRLGQPSIATPCCDDSPGDMLSCIRSPVPMPSGL